MCYNLYSTVETLMTRDGSAVIDAKVRYSTHKAEVMTFHDGDILRLLSQVDIA